MFVDTHAHLFYPNFKDDLDEVIQRAKEAGVDYILVPATDLASAAQVVDLTEKYDMVYGAVGVHPHDSREWTKDLIPLLEDLIKNNPKIVAVGEIGLDYYYDFSPKDKQIEAFRDQIDLALKLNYPVIVHNRESDADVLNIIKEYTPRGLKAQLHCFNSTEEYVYEYVKLGHYISFTGNITFKKFDTIRSVAAKVTPEKLLLETDSPFMTPVPYRGKRNEPAHVKLVAEMQAEVHKKTVEEIARVTSFNAYRLYGIGNLPEPSLTYKLYNSLYVNITNRCNADCFFCTHKDEPFLAGYNLRLDPHNEPPAEDYISQIGDPKLYDEIVYCGFGEPTLRWDIVKEVSRYVKENGGKTRINTNGHGSFLNKKNITEEMKGLIDSVSISLNTIDIKEYSEIMKVDENFFDVMVEFAKNCKKNGIRVIMSVVGLKEIDIQAAKDFVVEELGAEFRERPLF